jgi:hypothetical protein
MTTRSKNGLAALSQLNDAKANIATRDLDPAMVLTPVDLSVAQEIPK